METYRSGNNKQENIRSYRTYEEWKQHRNHRQFANKRDGSYRTYEEWKPTNMAGSLTRTKVLTVPMRNGNP